MTATKKLTKIFILLSLFIMLFATCSLAVSAEGTTEAAVAVAEEAADNSAGMKAVAAAITVGLAAAAGAIGMGIAIAKSVEGISRQPEAEGKIRTSLMLGLVFVETAIIYALIIAVLIIFVL
ncbi:MAG: ATP synthase F0 subunit C [Clostridia bacterium]|nr:ATP synthase F0 subunit C [Clostridia bacterium]MEE1054282.1 ATP synthase F0 subunit C [Acutalibacteraceae bacterium]